MKPSAEDKSSGQYANVPLELISSCKFSDSEFRVLTACISVKNITTDKGNPFTHSTGHLAKMACVSPKTVQRIIPRFLKNGIFTIYGYITNKTRKYEVYQFNFLTLKKILSTGDKLTLVVETTENTNENK